MRRLGAEPYGDMILTAEGEQAFVPYPLPRQLNLSSGTVYLLDKASRAIATLDGVGETIPNPNLLMRPLLRREALLSSMIEGTITSLSEVFAYEADRQGMANHDVREVINYVMAMQQGVEALRRLPISLRFVNEIHLRLLTGVRGEEKRPGELRSGQVYIGAPGSSIRDARFIPPPPDQVRSLFLDWEEFVNESLELPPLVRCAMMHYQFETIHPYEDGNGRVGRLLITLFLIASQVLSKPLLYLSAYFERDRQRYYDELLNVSITGDWERWFRYFLIGIDEESRDVMERIRRLRQLHSDYREVLQAGRASSSALQLLDELFANPFMTVRGASGILGMTTAGARGVLGRLVESGLVRLDSRRWPPRYIADDILAALESPMRTTGD